MSALADLQQQATRNSMRWFPELHARGRWEQIVHQALGLAGEAGEVANAVKKLNRLDAETVFQALAFGGEHADQLTGLADELADVFTYTLNLATLLGVDLESRFQAKQAVCEHRWGGT